MNHNAKLFQTLALATLLIWLSGCASCEQVEKRGGRASGDFDDDNARRRASSTASRKNTAVANSDDEQRKKLEGALVITDNSVFVDVKDLPKTPIAPWLTLEGYSNAVFAASFTADGKFLMTGGDDDKGTNNSLKIWSAETGEELRAWNANGNNFSFNREGKLAAITNSSDGTVSVRMLETGEELYTLKRGTRRFTVSPDGKYLAGIITSGENAGLNLWAAETGQLIGKLGRGGNCIAFSADSKKIAYDSDYKIIILSAETQQAQTLIPTPRTTVNVIRFSADGNLLAAGFSDNTVRVWSLKEQKLLRTLIGHQSKVTALALSPDGTLLVSGETSSLYDKEKDFSLRVWVYSKC
ncbi:MAG: WD40 repeat domain-containing protein [Candidatus Thermochlorobacter sp.]